jgi:hypothetical protein
MHSASATASAAVARSRERTNLSGWLLSRGGERRALDAATARRHFPPDPDIDPLLGKSPRVRSRLHANVQIMLEAIQLLNSSPFRSRRFSEAD